jgi:D-alanyl-D-alanine carboxypeptidase (penicillin-binding protein 5/6)
MQEDVSAYLTGGYPSTQSRYTMLMDVDSGRVIYSSNADVHREPASTTKMMAAIVLLERGKLTDIVTAPPGIDGVQESSLHLVPGEQLTLKDLLYGMLLRSANDAPVAGAYYLCGAVPPFVGLMNQKAADIGCLNTHFVTPNGLFDPNHYSCARDLALIARYGLLNLPDFDAIVRTRTYKIKRSVRSTDCVVVNTASTFLKSFPGADGVKTGFISQAGHCFVGSATRNGFRLVAVALDSNRCREDVMDMLSYGFKGFSPVVAVPKGTPEGTLAVAGAVCPVPVVCGRNLSDVVKMGSAPGNYTERVVPGKVNLRQGVIIHKGDRVGYVALCLNGKPVTFVPALAAANVQIAGTVSMRRFAGTSTSHLKWIKLLLDAVMMIAALVVIGFIGLVSYARTITKNSRRRRSRVAEEMRTAD